MQQATQMTEMDPARINRDFYYTLALLQYESFKYVARGADADNRLVRAKSITEQIQVFIKDIEEETNGVAEPCLPPCYPDKIWGRDCICPRIKGEDDVVGDFSDEVSTQM